MSELQGELDLPGAVVPRSKEGGAMPAGPQYRIVKVGKPDPYGGLWQIAQREGVSFDELKKANAGWQAVTGSCTVARN
jgi:hypothetical protein